MLRYFSAIFPPFWRMWHSPKAVNLAFNGFGEHFFMNEERIMNYAW